MNYPVYDALEQASDQQKKWFYRYLANGFNASEAARHANYEDDKQSGWENKKRFSKLIANELKQFQMSKDEALARISEIARGSLLDVINEHNDVSVHAAVQNGKAHLIKEVSYNQFGIKLKLHDVLKANHLIASGFGADDDNDSELAGILEALKDVNLEQEEALEVHAQDEANTS